MDCQTALVSDACAIEHKRVPPPPVLSRAKSPRDYPRSRAEISRVLAAIEQNHSDDSDWISEWGANGPLAELTWILGERRVG